MIRAETLAAAEAENRAIADEHDDGEAVLAQAPIDPEALLVLSKRRALTFHDLFVTRAIAMSPAQHLELLHMALAAAWVDGAIVGSRAAQIEGAAHE